jgi:hypothetical protein
MPKRKKQKSKELISDECTMYCGLFPSRNTITVPFNKEEAELYEACKTRFPDRFNLEHIVDFFQQWMQQDNINPAALKTQLDGARSNQIRYVVQYDQLRWNTKVRLADVKETAAPVVLTDLKFSNDGFLYTPTERYKIMKGRSQLKMHKGDTWAQLHESAYDAAFAPLRAFGVAYLGGAVQLQVYHNFDLERIDVRMKRSDETTQTPTRERINLTFEPGQPDGGYDMDDYWV